jgi:hypothetical protein
VGILCYGIQQRRETKLLLLLLADWGGAFAKKILSKHRTLVGLVKFRASLDVICQIGWLSARKA